jgi:hypothetical protein
MSCNAQKKQHIDAYVFGSSFANIIYEGISNDVSYKSLSNNDKNNFKVSADSNCKVINHEGYFSIIPDTGTETAVINILINDIEMGYFIFNVQKLPFPKLMYTTPSEIDHLYLPDFISKNDLKYLQDLDAFVQNGFMSYFKYKIDFYDILIIKQDNTVINLRNETGIMQNKNFEILEKLDIGDRFCFININCHGNGKENLVFNEGIITIKK